MQSEAIRDLEPRRERDCRAEVQALRGSEQRQPRPAGPWPGWGQGWRVPYLQQQRRDFMVASGTGMNEGCVSTYVLFIGFCIRL